VFGIDEDHHPKVAAMALSAEKFTRACLRDLRDNGTRFVIAGQTGVGKTHIAERITRYIATRQIDAWAWGWWTGSHIPAPSFIRWPDAVRAKDESWETIVGETQAARFIVLDDLGAENDRYRNDEGTSRLHTLFETLRPAWKWLLVTTNVPVAQWKSRWDQRISDRLMACARIDLTSVPSYRITYPTEAR
jgi:DNA replication protein DnaC